jgi:hypothetical protein
MAEVLAQFSFGLYTLIQGFLLCSLVLESSPYRWLFWCLITGIAYHLIFNTTTGSVTDYVLGSAIASNVFAASDYILLTDVQRELRLLDQHEPTFDLPLNFRLKWALKLLFSPRGVGWTHEPKSVIRPHPGPMPRAEFVVYQLAWTAFFILLYDASYTYMLGNPSFAPGGPSLAAYGWSWRCLNVLVHGVSAATQLSMQYGLLSVVTTVLGLSKPQDWPPLFGFWSDGYTLRRFWGYDQFLCIQLTEVC